jgi:hypothetical protein
MVLTRRDLAVDAGRQHVMMCASPHAGPGRQLAVIGCKNCGSHFTHDEMLRLRPPTHAWPLTATGRRIRDENLAAGRDQSP